MMTDYDFQERVAIKMDSHIPEKLAITQTKHETEPPECVERILRLRDRKKIDDAAKHAKNATRFNYKD